MYEIVIKDYISKLSEDKIIEYGKKNNIDISFDDAKVLYVYAKNYWKEFYKEYPKDLILELKEKIKPDTFDKLFELYKKVKKKQ